MRLKLYWWMRTDECGHPLLPNSTLMTARQFNLHKTITFFCFIIPSDLGLV